MSNETPLHLEDEDESEQSLELSEITTREDFDGLELPAHVKWDHSETFGFPGNYWAVSPTGDGKLDAEMGIRLADEDLAWVRRWRCPTLIGLTLAQIMVTRGAKLSSIELGYIGRIARAAMHGASN